MVRIGIAGLGFMGMIHHLAGQRLRGAAVTAVCSRDTRKLAGDWTSIRGNFGPPGTHMDLGAISRYEHFDQLLADPAIDLVDVCTPTHLHAPMAIAALQAGKHVLVEKAIALTTDDADAMVEAARKAGKLLMVAHVLPFFSEFSFAASAVRDGRYGKLIGGHFKRVISRPDWSADIADNSRTGGPAVDLHIHDTHFLGLIAGVPQAVFSVGVIGTDGAVEYLTTQYLYGPGGPALSCSSGAVAMNGRPFVHGYEIYLEKATLAYDSGGIPLTVFTPGGKETPDLGGSADPVVAFAVEIQTAVDGVLAGREPDLLRGQLARDALILCHRECESVRSGRSVAVC